MNFSYEYGSVAQLNSASDFGSEGYRFESCRGHNLKGYLTDYMLGSFFVSRRINQNHRDNEVESTSFLTFSAAPKYLQNNEIIFPLPR
jgi:hypothetical protein